MDLEKQMKALNRQMKVGMCDITCLKAGLADALTYIYFSTLFLGRLD